MAGNFWNFHAVGASSTRIMYILRKDLFSFRSLYEIFLPVVMGLEPEIGERSWHSMSSCFTLKNSEVNPVDGDEINIEDVAEVGVLGIEVEPLDIIMPILGEVPKFSVVLKN